MKTTTNAPLSADRDRDDDDGGDSDWQYDDVVRGSGNDNDQLTDAARSGGGYESPQLDQSFLSSVVSESLFHSCMSTSYERDPPTAAEGDALTVEGVAFAAAPNDGGGSDGGSKDDVTPDSSANSSWKFLVKAEPEEVRPVVRSVTFNREGTCVLFATSNGVTIRALGTPVGSAAAPPGDSSAAAASGWIRDVPLPPDGASHAQLLRTTSLLCAVRPSSPRCVSLIHARDGSNLAALPLPAAVRRVELNGRTLVALTADGRLYIFFMGRASSSAPDAAPPSGGGNDPASSSWTTPRWIQTLSVMHPADSVRNVTRGVEALNAGAYFDLWDGGSYLACKSFDGTSGTVRVYDPAVVDEATAAGPTGGGVAADGAASVGGMSARSLTSAGSASILSGGSGCSPSPIRRRRTRMRLLSTIDAHDHAVARMVIGGRRGGDRGRGNAASSSGDGAREDDDGPTLATVSSNGTTVRVFGLPKGERLWEWHRGSRPCQFHSVSWNGSAADRVVAYGSRGTIHVFGAPCKGKGGGGKDGSTNNGKWGGGAGSGMGNSDVLTDFQAIGERRKSYVPPEPDERSVEAGEGSKPFFQRVGRALSFRRHSSIATLNAAVDSPSPGKHRSYAKINPQFSNANAADGGGRTGGVKPSLIVQLLGIPSGGPKGGASAGASGPAREDVVVVCSSDGELRQYSVRSDGTSEMVRMEDVFNVVHS